MNKAPTTYRIIGFGYADYGFFNQPRFASTYADAFKDFTEFMADAIMDGAVLIEVQHETWRVIDEFGTQCVSIVYGPLGTFKVQQAPEVTLV